MKNIFSTILTSVYVYLWMDTLDKTKHIIPVCSESSLIDVEAF